MRADLLHVVVPVSNPIRWNSRIKLAKDFIPHMLDDGVKLYIVECVLGDRPFELDEMAHVTHIGTRHSTIAWHKESLCNIGLSRLPHDAKYVGFVDADIQFRNPSWASDSVHALQQYQVIQPWEHAYDLGPAPGGDHIDVYQSFCSLVQKQLPIHPQWSKTGYHNAHTGYAWCYRRDVLDQLGGLMDFCILGSADAHMAWSFLGRGLDTFKNEISPQFTAAVAAWQDLAVKYVGSHGIGYLPGTIEHIFHGAKKFRFYMDRRSILLKHNFNPVSDIKKNTFGVLELSGNNPGLARDVDGYMRSRNEDASTM